MVKPPKTVSTFEPLVRMRQPNPVLQAKKQFAIVEIQSAASLE